MVNYLCVEFGVFLSSRADLEPCRRVLRFSALADLSKSRRSRSRSIINAEGYSSRPRSTGGRKYKSPGERHKAGNREANWKLRKSVEQSAHNKAAYREPVYRHDKSTLPRPPFTATVLRCSELVGTLWQAREGYFPK